MRPGGWGGRAHYPARMTPDAEPHEMLGLPAFGFGDAGPLRDSLTAAVLAGGKVSTASLVIEYIIDGEPLPAVGQRAVFFDSARRPVGVIETTGVRLATIGTVEDGFARDEGEGFADAADWRVAHERFWGGHLDDYRTGLGDPGFVLTASTAVVCEWYRLVARVDPATGRIERVAPDDGRGRLESGVRAFVAAARTATLATIRPDGRPRLVPICHAFGPDDPFGRAVLDSPLDEKPKAVADPLSLARVRDILARPQATLLLERWSEDWDRLGWVRLEAEVAVLGVGDPGHLEAVSALRARYPQYRTQRLEDRPILRFTIERVTTWGDLGNE